MENLFEGALKFRSEDFESHRSLFESLGKLQKPHTLFIGCSDSRLVPNMITKSQPGELFIVRNIANIVPMYRESEEYLATTSAIEFAIQALGIKKIVVCGHSNCGGCAALYYPAEKLAKTPHTAKWLELAHPVKTEVLALGDSVDESAREWMTEQLNIVLQLKHLMTYPFVESGVKSGEITIHGWHYVIQTGEVFNYNFDQKVFELIS
jgi:carbonic anhydrase